MNVIPLAISDVLVIEPDVFVDARGFFMESWQRRKFAEAGLDYDFVQDNHSRSAQGTLRGLHYQVSPHTQGKLVRVTVGEVFDVAVDLRKSSSTFGEWISKILSAECKDMLWVPPGFAHGFYVTSDVAEFQYKCTDYYAPECERRIRWDDPELSIAWPVTRQPMISDKDLQGYAFAQAECFN
jgi:dTDP-4-dehydrorhamnose 3,5-epimerase